MLIRFDKNILVIFAVLWKWSSVYNCHENFTSTNMHIEYVNYEAEIFFYFYLTRKLQRKKSQNMNTWNKNTKFVDFLSYQPYFFYEGSIGVIQRVFVNIQCMYQHCTVHVWSIYNCVINEYCYVLQIYC